MADGSRTRPPHIDVEVHVYKEREKYGYGIAIVKDRSGNEVFRFKIRAEGTGGTDRMKQNANTPLGEYDIPDQGMWTSGGSRKSYGPNHRLVLNGKSGEIAESGRSAIRIHGGRQEVFNEKTGNWEKVEDPKLKKTHGCMRSYDDDIKEMKTITDNLQKNDAKEFGGTLTVVDDLVEQNGEYILPPPSPNASQNNAPKLVDIDMPDSSIPIDNTYVAPPVVVPLTKGEKSN